MATKKTTKIEPNAPGKPAVKMVKLVDGGERPETAADRRSERHQAKLQKKKPDGAKAFDIAAAMEDDLEALHNLLQALHMVTEGMDEGMESKAVTGLAYALGEHLERMKEQHGEIFHLTWGYHFGSQATPGGVMAEPKTNKSEQLDAIDIVTARLSQAGAVVLALKIAYTEQLTDGMQHILCPASMLNALDAVALLIDQADTAATVLSKG